MSRLGQYLELARCPHCGIDKPQLMGNKTIITNKYDGSNKRFWKLYSCVNCGGGILAASSEQDGTIHEMYPSSPQETFEYEHLPNQVADDFREALICYSNNCFNAFAAMCRRCIQSISAELGALGTDKVSKQLGQTREMGAIDDETFEILKQIIIAGHDGAHPHLPKLSEERASILVEMMKDVLTQLFVRKKKLQEAVEARRKAIDDRKTTKA